MDMKKTLIFLTICYFYIFNSWGQDKMNFNIVHNGNSIGKLYAEKKQDNESVVYKSATNISYHLVVSIKVVHENEVVFKNGNFQNSSIISQIGKHKKNEYITSNNNGKISYSVNGKEVRKVDNINATVTQLFFEEPVNIESVYSEEKGEFHKIKPLSKGVYLKSDSKGNKNTYYYKNGELQKIDIDTSTISFSMVKN